MKPALPRLLLITDSAVCSDLPRAVAAALAGGVRHLLLRERNSPAGPMIPLARRLLTLTRAQGAALLIHDRVDVALAVGAEGVHLPAQGMATVEARRLLSRTSDRSLLLGRSCHSVETAEQALQEGADYVTLSPLFATRSHPDMPPLGVAGFAALRARIPGPVIALGGIQKANAAQAMATGADGIALIRGILADPDPRQAAEAMLAILGPTLD